MLRSLLVIVTIFASLTSTAFADFEANKNKIVRTPLPYYVASDASALENHLAVLNILKQIALTPQSAEDTRKYLEVLLAKRWASDGPATTVMEADLPERIFGEDTTTVPGGPFAGLAYQLYTAAFAHSFSLSEADAKAYERLRNRFPMLLKRATNILQMDNGRYSATQQQILWDAVLASIEIAINYSDRVHGSRRIHEDNYSTAIAFALAFGSQTVAQRVASGYPRYRIVELAPQLSSTTGKFGPIEFRQVQIELLYLMAKWSRGSESRLETISNLSPNLEAREPPPVTKPTGLVRVFIENSTSEALPRHQPRMRKILGLLNPWILGYALSNESGNLSAAIRSVSTDLSTPEPLPKLTEVFDIPLSSDFGFTQNGREHSHAILHALSTYVHSVFEHGLRQAYATESVSNDIDRILSRTWSPQDGGKSIRIALDIDQRHFTRPPERYQTVFRLAYQLHALRLSYALYSIYDLDPVTSEFREIISHQNVIIAKTIEALRSPHLDDEENQILLTALLRCHETALTYLSRNDLTNDQKGEGLPLESIGRNVAHTLDILKRYTFDGLPVDRQFFKQRYDCLYLETLLVAAKLINRDPENFRYLSSASGSLQSPQAFAESLLEIHGVLQPDGVGTKPWEPLLREVIEAAQPWLSAVAYLKLGKQTDTLTDLIRRDSPSAASLGVATQRLCDMFWKPHRE